MRLPSTAAQSRDRAGITLTEILIAILILAVGIASLATLFPLGLLRLRDAARYSRSSYLAQSAAADVSARSLLLPSSFALMDLQNYAANNTTPVYWYQTASGEYNPFVQDTAAYGSDWALVSSGPGAYAGPGGIGSPSPTWLGNAFNNPSPGYLAIPGPGLPVAYDPLWRYLAVNPSLPNANGTATPGGYYLNDPGAFEARFGDGTPFLRNDPSGGAASAYGLQRISNFNRPIYMPASVNVPSVFVSPEDLVWQEPTNQYYYIAANSVSLANGSGTPPIGSAPSTVLPDLSIPLTAGAAGPPQLVSDFRYSWMVTGSLTNASSQSCFDGNIVIFENRPFGFNAYSPTVYQTDGETIVEAIFGHSGNINSGGYGVGADRTVLLRWTAGLPDPVVKSGDWIADVTYERNQATVISRWWANSAVPIGVPNPNNNNEWDNLPAQRCYWYQVQKVLPAVTDPYLGASYRSMVVYVNQKLLSKTLLTSVGVPVVLNAALVAPSVVNVIPQTFFIR